ncbi:MAG: DUF4124 domain-containing protein [Thiolinea sp.]
MVVLVASSGVLHAEIYRWVDENGVTNYSDEPLKKRELTKDGVEILEFIVPEKAPAQAKAPAESDNKPAIKTAAKELSDLLSESAIEQILKLTKEDSAIKADRCQALRRQLAALEEKDFATYRDEEGNYRVSWGDDGVYTGKREYLSRNEINTQTTEIKEQLQQSCAKADDDDEVQADARAEWIRSEHCALNKIILADLKKPELRTADSAIRVQEATVQRYCAVLAQGEYRDDEDYYPGSFPVRGKQ